MGAECALKMGCYEKYSGFGEFTQMLFITMMIIFSGKPKYWVFTIRLPLKMVWKTQYSQL